MSMNCYTCLTCRVVLPSADGQRDHYKQDWHSYNLKRKLAALPPVTSEQFVHVARLHLTSDGKRANAADDQKASYCHTCGKQFNNCNAFSQHLQSKRHKTLDKVSKEVKVSEQTSTESAKAIDKTIPVDENIEDDDDSDWESVDSDAETDEPIAANECLFCEESSGTVEDNISHMSQKHSFFIPDVEYVKSLEPLLLYLGEKVGSGHLCLWCCHSSRDFRTRRSAQQHMRDMGHTKMCHSGDCFFEYTDFYDYSTSYPDEDRGQHQDEEVVIPELDDQDWQLSLPSGAVIGHRSLFRYYKQNLKPVSDKSTHTKSSAILDKVLLRYRSLGWTGITGEVALQRAKDIKYMQKIQRKQDLKVGLKNNRNLQTHFRSQQGF